MKVKYQQLYSNECGVCAIKNLLQLNHIKKFDFSIKYNENGTSLYEMSKILKKYFRNVNVVEFSIYEIRKVKKFTPFICLIKKNNISHYIVIYKKNNKYLYIMDSLAKRTYKITYKMFEQFEIIANIIAENKKEVSFSLFQFKNAFIIFIISIFESLFMLSTTILLQQIIDNGYKNALLYLIVQASLLIFTTYKCNVFLKIFKKIDKDIIYNTMNNIYSLKKSYLNKHPIDEVYYRLSDAYTYKSMVLSLIFNILNDVILAVLAIILMFIYSYILALIVLIACIIVIIIACKLFFKTKDIVEKRRVSEYTFFNGYRDSFSNNIKQSSLKTSQENLLKFQFLDYCYSKLNIIKNLILLYFQTIMISLIVLLYFTNFYNVISIGSLVALINLVTIVLQPILNLCSEITNFSNYNLVIKRLKDINENQ